MTQQTTKLCVNCNLCSKARTKRRYVLGLREVTKHLKTHKLKCVIISPNLERVQSKGRMMYREPVFFLFCCCTDAVSVIQLLCQWLTAQVLCPLLTKLRLWHQVIAQAFSNLGQNVKFQFVIETKKNYFNEQFIKLEFICTGIVSIHLLHEGFKSSRWLISTLPFTSLMTKWHRIFIAGNFFGVFVLFTLLE